MRSYPILGDVWQWLDPATWLNAMYQAVKEGAMAICGWLWGLAEPYAVGLLDWLWEIVNKPEVLPTVEAFGEVFTMALGINCWVPLDTIMEAVAVYYGFLGALLCYRLVKSWIPTVGG